MKLVNGTPWKSASMGRALPTVLILIGYGEKVKGGDGADELMQSQRGLLNLHSKIAYQSIS